MIIFVDHRIPVEAKKKLSTYGELLEVKTEGIVYDAISGHPDIFFCQAGEKLITAPNTPRYLIDKLNEKKVPFVFGEQPLGGKYPDTAHYNAVVTDEYLIHNFRYVDMGITHALPDIELIHVNQGYCHCNLMALKENHFITSDEGIKKVLEQNDMDVLYVDPEGILLPGHKHGFFGGTCGVQGDKVFILGSLRNYAEGEKVSAYLGGLGYEIIELYDGALFDGGGIIFIYLPHDP